MPKNNQGWRAGGLLLHPSSLYSPYGIGDLGPGARLLAGFMKKAGLQYWQTLPLTPTSSGLGNSPYSSFSVYGGNTLLVSPDMMVRDGWLQAHEAKQAETAPSSRVDFDCVQKAKDGLIELAFGRAESSLERHAAFQQFTWDNGAWLNDLAFFKAAKDLFGGAAWLNWPEPLKWRDNAALHHYGTDLGRAIKREKFAQYLFFSQLAELKELLAAQGLGLIGDAAIYVNHDSCDVWAQPHLFHLDETGQSRAVAGVPPDYFAKDGQLWGNPLFNWAEHRRDGFEWWKNRLWHSFKLYDWIRLDHFRAFAAYWEVPAGAETAAPGRWQPGPGAELFQAATIEKPLNIIAEDLGFITPDVTELRRLFGYPGMRVLQFAFGPDMGFNAHAPYRIEPDNVVFSGTHDNNTSRGWYRQEATAMMRQQLNELAGYGVCEENAAQALIRLAWLSSACLAMTPLQDILNLDESARMNVPGDPSGNWAWKMAGPEVLTDELAASLADLGALAGRDNYEHPNTLTY